MRRRTAPAALLAALVGGGVTLVSACGGGQDDHSDALQVRTTGTRLERNVEVEGVTYRSSDGRRVSGLFASPRGVSPRGCLMWQMGAGSGKEDAAVIWQQAARLGLAVFSIDLRRHGRRDRGRLDVERPTADARRLAAPIRGSISDLKRGLGYLERRGECRKNIGYGGKGLGGMLGSVLAGSEPRIRATVLMSTPPTWQSSFASGAPVLPGIRKDPARLRRAERVLSPLDPIRWIPRISPRPVMLLVGRNDPLVPPGAAARTRSATRSPKQIVDYPGSNPLRGRGAERTMFLIESFLLRWLVEPTYGS